MMRKFLLKQPGDFNGDNEKEDITRHVVDACRIINAKTRKKIHVNIERNVSITAKMIYLR